MSEEKSYISRLCHVRQTTGRIIRDSYCEDDCGEACFSNQD